MEGCMGWKWVAFEEVRDNIVKIYFVFNAILFQKISEYALDITVCYSCQSLQLC